MRPCSEIFYDHGEHIPGGPPGSPDEDGDRFVEIWNLVFMQYEQAAGEIVSELPKKSIDTGMGLERIAAVLQGVHDNYDTDTFKALIARQRGADAAPRPRASRQASHRVIADHLRASGFLVADGVLPANEGRGYVLRRIMRRAMRHAHLLGAKEPLMYRLVPALVAEMGAAYPELVRAQPLIEATLQQEETRFRQTLVTGLKLLDEATADLARGRHAGRRDRLQALRHLRLPLRSYRGRVCAPAAFTSIARVSTRRWPSRKPRHGRPGRAPGAKASEEIWFDLVEEHGATEFTGYSGDEGEGVVLAIVKDGARVENAEIGETVEILLNQTPFYGESGGQIGDTGKLTTLKGFVGEVEDTSKPLGKLHVLRTKVDAGELSMGETVHQMVDSERRDRIRANHSATHLLHAALRRQLGTHVTQKGSLVAPDYFRFDFSHPKALTREEIETVEAEVNAQIRSNEAGHDPADDAGRGDFGGSDGAVRREIWRRGARAFDGPSHATRIIRVELCGGTHVRALGDIQLLKIIGESAVSSGVRRIEALTGEAARQWLGDRDAKLREAAATLKSSPDEVPARIAALVEERRRLERELADAKKALAMGGGGAKAEAAAPEDVNGHKFLGQVVEGLDPKGLRSTVDDMKKQLGSGIARLDRRQRRACQRRRRRHRRSCGTGQRGRPRQGRCGDVGGQGGGGRPDMAQGGGPDGSKAREAIEAVKDALEKVAA